MCLVYTRKYNQSTNESVYAHNELGIGRAQMNEDREIEWANGTEQRRTDIHKANEKKKKNEITNQLPINRIEKKSKQEKWLVFFCSAALHTCLCNLWGRAPAKLRLDEECRMHETRESEYRCAWEEKKNWRKVIITENETEWMAKRWTEMMHSLCSTNSIFFF